MQQNKLLAIANTDRGPEWLGKCSAVFAKPHAPSENYFRNNRKYWDVPGD